MNVALVIIISLMAILMSSLLWRFISSRHTLPCPTWLAWMVELDNPFTKTNQTATILSHLELAPGMEVIDIGCGPGRVTIPLAQALNNTGKVTAMDIQAGMLERVKHKASLLGLNNIAFLHAALAPNVLPPNYYDRALLVTVLGEIPDKENALQSIFNTLKPQGILLITEVIFDPHFQHKKKVLKLATKVGFKEKRTFGSSLAFAIQLKKP